MGLILGSRNSAIPFPIVFRIAKLSVGKSASRQQPGGLSHPPYICEGDAVLPVHGPARSEGDPVKQRKTLRLRDFVQGRLCGHPQPASLSEQQSPTGGHFMLGDHVGIGDDPEQVGRSPLYEPVELGVGVEDGGQALDVL